MQSIYQRVSTYLSICITPIYSCVSIYISKYLQYTARGLFIYLHTYPSERLCVRFATTIASPSNSGAAVKSPLPTMTKESLMALKHLASNFS